MRRAEYIDFQFRDMLGVVHQAVQVWDNGLGSRYGRACDWLNDGQRMVGHEVTCPDCTAYLVHVE